jgi:NMD protein affecting ribosome stability and mRNA decay
LPSVLGEAAVNLVSRKARFAEELAQMGLRISAIEADKVKVTKDAVLLEATANIEGMGEPLEVKLAPRISLERTNCRTCQLRDSEFYACLLQIRASGRIPDPQELDSAEGLVREKALASDPNSMDYISRVTDRREGRDIYLGSPALGRASAKEIVHRMGGILGETRKLVGVERGTGKRQYRFTLLVRLPELRVGDITEHRDAYHAVLHQSGSRTTLLDLEGNTLTFEGGRGEELPLVSRREQLGEALVTEARPDGIQILDPKTNETFDAEKPPWGVRAGDSIGVFWVDGVPRPAPRIEGEGSD